MILNSDVSAGINNNTGIKTDVGINVNSEGASSTQVSWLGMMVRLLLLFIVSIIVSFSFSWRHDSGSGNNVTLYHQPKTEALMSPVIAMYSSQPLQSSFTDACLQDKVGIYRCGPHTLSCLIKL